MGKVVRKATTFRIDPVIRDGLVKLSRLLGQPINKLVADALGKYVVTGNLEV